MNAIKQMNNRNISHEEKITTRKE